MDASRVNKCHMGLKINIFEGFLRANALSLNLTHYISTQAQVQPVSTPIFNPVPAHQVFQADQTAVITILQQMMEEMRSWRNPAPSPQVHPLLHPQIWSQGSQAPQIGWGSPSNQTQSQSQ